MLRTAIITKLIRLIFGVCAIVVAGTGQTLTQDLDWSFIDHPHPNYEKLSIDEREQLSQDIVGFEVFSFCRLTLANAFDFYERRFPEFRKSGELDLRYRTWKNFILQSDNTTINACRNSIAGLELQTRHAEFEAADLTFCGGQIKPPNNSLGRYFHYLTDQLLENAETGQKDPLTILLSTAEITPLVALNPDVEYFVRKSLERIGESKPSDWDVTSLLPQLDAERIVFLNDAIETNNFRAVVATTKPCAKN